jgi:hypothetical protein
MLTNSNGRDMGLDNIKAHIPRLQKDKVDIRVEVVYTLKEAYDKLGRGSLIVEGESVLLDVSTNNVRGTERTPRTRPERVAWRFEKVARLLLEKGASEVCMCKVKPMSFMDVDQYCHMSEDACPGTPCLWGQHSDWRKSPEEGWLPHLTVLLHGA